MSTSNYAEKIREARPRLSKSFVRLADYILDSYIQAALMTALELAHEVDVDAATVVRFAQALDYSGFPDLQDEIKERVLDDLHLRPQEIKEPDSIAAQADQTLGKLAEAVERFRRLLAPEAFESLVAAIAEAQEVIILADPGAQAVAERFSYQLEALGHSAKVIRPEEGSLAQALAAASKGDLALAIDMAGETALISAALVQAKAFELSTAAIVGAASFEAARNAAIVLEVQYQELAEAGDVILAALFEALGAALRWQGSVVYEEHLARVLKARRRMARKNR